MNRQPDEQPELLKAGEVARMLRVARSTVLSWAYRGLLDYTRTPGGQLRFYRDQVEAIVAAGRRPSAPPRLPAEPPATDEEAEEP